MSSSHRSHRWVFTSSIIVAVIIGFVAGHLSTQTGTESEVLERTTTVIEVITSYATETVTLEPPSSRSQILGVCFSKTSDCEALIVSWFEKANSSIYMMIYSFTSNDIAEALIQAHRKGIDVKIVMDDQQASIRGSEYERLVGAGIPTRLDNRAGLMHHKVAIIDGVIVLTGSYNYTAAAENDNDENLILIRDEKVAKMYLEEFLRVWELGK